MTNNVDLNSLEENTHFVLYYLSKAYPNQPKKQDIVAGTGLSGNTISSKLNALKELKLIKTKRSGRGFRYFIDENIKQLFDEWSATDIGQNTIQLFEEKLSKL
ncbi:MAG: hypothetical protein ACFFD4_39625 [Candidatus Odinarchaeota archaeon]